MAPPDRGFTEVPVVPWDSEVPLVNSVAGVPLGLGRYLARVEAIFGSMEDQDIV